MTRKKIIQPQEHKAEGTQLSGGGAPYAAPLPVQPRERPQDPERKSDRAPLHCDGRITSFDLIGAGRYTFRITIEILLAQGLPARSLPYQATDLDTPRCVSPP